MRTPLTLFAAVLVLAFGAEAAQAAVHLTINIKGAGSVHTGDKVLCSSTDPNDQVVGGRCELDRASVFIPLTAVPADAPAQNWRFSTWAGECQQSEPGSPVCVVVGGILESELFKTVTVRFEDYRSPV